MKVTSPRGRILEEALGLTQGDRNKTYGSPTPNLECFAKLADAYLELRFLNMPDTTESLNAVDGSILMVLAKVSRVAVNQGHKDTFVDMAAYAAIAAECAGIGCNELFEEEKSPNE